jgi:hypothetical protein
MSIEPRSSSRDTPLDVEREWIALQRERGGAWRVQRAIELSSFCWHQQRDAFHRAHPGASEHDCDAYLLRERYGEELAMKVLAHRDALEVKRDGR